MKKLILFLVLTVVVSGCASSIKTYDSAQKQTVGIPISTPVLVKITEETSYDVDPNNAKYESFCKTETNSKYQFLALGEKSYVNLDAAYLGKSEFKVEFTDSGSLKSVSLNSDATAGASKVNDLLGTVLPYLAAPKPAAEERALAEGDTAQKTKDKYCIKKGTKVISVERVDIKLPPADK